ncbi:MAG: MFS transporter [Dehalococcoidia bacterium]
MTAGPPDAIDSDSPIPGIPRNVFVLGLVSFAADISTEMLYPVLPIFLTTTLGTPVALVGVIEGIAEGTANVSKVPAGWVSDQMPERRPLIAGGYGLAALGKLLLALSFVWPVALLARFTDRLGKGVRTSPRDALIADSSTPEQRGRAFGFHRAMDTAGAVLGPLIGLAMVMAIGENHLRPIFALAVIPAVLSVVLVSLARERKRHVVEKKGERTKLDLSGAPPGYWLLIGVSLLFAFGNSSDVFLLLRAKDLGLGLEAVILVYVLYNVAYAALAFPAGILADRIAPRWVLVGGYVVFGLVYLGFALDNGSALVWLLFPAYGIPLAMTEGVSKALVSNLVPADRRGAFLGLHATAIGLTAVVASVLAGVLWDQVGPAAPFALGAATGIAAAVLLAFIPARALRLRSVAA